MGRLENIYVRRMTNYLVARGKEIINEAAASKEAGNRSMNQLDAYGLIVYYNGKSQRTIVGDVSNGGFTSVYRSPDPYNISDAMSQKKKFKDLETLGGGVHKGWKKEGIPDGTGYEWARMFIRGFKQVYKPPARGFALVIFNAAYYSKILEEGGGNVKRKYRVLSQIVGSLQSLQSQFKGSNIVGHNITI